MSDWNRKYREAVERSICEARGIAPQELAAQYAALRKLDATDYADLAPFQTLLANGFDLNRDRGNEGETLLMGAARRGRAETVVFLIARGADVNLQDMYGFSALMYAAVSGDIDCVRELLSSGADPYVQSEPTMSEPSTALSLADRFNHPDVREEIERFLCGQ